MKTKFIVLLTVILAITLLLPMSSVSAQPDKGVVTVPTLQAPRLTIPLTSECILEPLVTHMSTPEGVDALARRASEHIETVIRGMRTIQSSGYITRPEPSFG